MGAATERYHLFVDLFGGDAPRDRGYTGPGTKKPFGIRLPLTLPVSAPPRPGTISSVPKPRKPYPSTQVRADPKKKTPATFAGKWRIVETETWDAEALHLLAPGALGAYHR